jgi:hypothetical protein
LIVLDISRNTKLFGRLALVYSPAWWGPIVSSGWQIKHARVKSDASESPPRDSRVPFNTYMADIDPSAIDAFLAIDNIALRSFDF